MGRLLERHPCTRRAAAKPKGEKFSRCCCFPAALQGSSLRCWQAGLGAMLGSILPSRGSSQVNQLCVITNIHYPERTKPARMGDFCRRGCKMALRRFAGKWSNPKPCGDQYQPTCSYRCMPVVAPETKAEKLTVRGHSLGQAGGQRVFLTLWPASQPRARHSWSWHCAGGSAQLARGRRR